MTAEEYRKDPCRASSLPFWKTEGLRLPATLRVLREDAFSAADCVGADEPYFKLIRGPEPPAVPRLPARFVSGAAEPEELARHIAFCYERERVSAAELRACRERPVYDPSLWLAVRERESGRIAASGIAELDPRIGEGVLEWIQVSPDFRREGLGRFVVGELLRRMRGRAAFVTVSGRAGPDGPMGFYLACGFRDPVIWHVVRTDARGGKG